MRFCCQRLCLSALYFSLFLTGSAMAAAIESGQWISDYMDWDVTNRMYWFYAASNDSVIVRTAGEAPHDMAPCSVLWAPDYSAALDTFTNEHYSALHEIKMPQVTKTGWYYFHCTPPPGVSWVEGYSFSVSILRMADYPLSYQDTDVGAIYSGKSLSGKVDAGADLDAAFFAVTNPCTVQIRMGQGEVLLVPKLQLYDPDGQLVINDIQINPEYRSEITKYITATGIYTIVMNDEFNAFGNYSVCMVRIPGEMDPGDADIGAIGNGESRTGTINEPGDLDIAMITVQSNDVIRLSMREKDTLHSDLNPRIELYGPGGALIAKGADPFQINAVISNTCVTSGTHYVICKDSQDRHGVQYILGFDIITGPSLSNMPDIPTNIAATDGVYSNYVEVTWSLAAGATNYVIARKFSTNDWADLHTNNVSGPPYRDYSVQSNVLYEYKVKSHNSLGFSDYSGTDSGYAAGDFASAPRRALLVGINHYDPAYGPGDLNACINDAIGVRDKMLLADPDMRWSTNAILTFTDAQATRTRLRDTMRFMAASATTNDMVLYFHSSHGGQQPGGEEWDTFICAHDADYSDADFAADLALFNPYTWVFVILDTCHSGGMFKSDEPWPFAERVMRHYQRIKAGEYLRKGEPVPKALGNNIAFITAADYNEMSVELGSNGVFTGFMLEACGTPKADSNRDGQLQFSELYSYAYPKALAVYSGQHAQYYNWDLLAWGIARARGTGTGRATLWPDCDFNGDAYSDLTAYNIYTGEWYIYSLLQGVLTWGYPWGGDGHYPVSGDFDGDKWADLAVYNQSQGKWNMLSMDGRLLGWDVAWGGKHMAPVCADFNGDGASDLGVYNTPDGFWYIRDLPGNVLLNGVSWTGTGYDAVPGDYDGDGRADCAMYHEASGYWYALPVSGTNIIVPGVLWGSPGLAPVPGDYDGDGISDLAVFYPAIGQWFVRAADGTILAWTLPWGGPDFMPVPGDFDGDGAFDLTVYNIYTGEWYSYSLANQAVIMWQGQWGGYGFVPALPTW